MNSEHTRKALELVGNPNILVNLVSRRVRQLTSGGGAASRPLISETAGLGMADIAMVELIEGKMSWEMLKPLVEEEPTTKRRRKS